MSSTERIRAHEFERAYQSITTSASVQEAVERLRDVFDAHVVYHLAQCPDRGVDAPFVKATYPPAWVGHYIVNDYVSHDPVCVEGFKRQLPFDWAELTPTKMGLKIFTQAVEFGLGGSGYSVPLVDGNGRRALFSVNAPLIGEAWEAFMDLHRETFAELGQALHVRAIAEVFGDKGGGHRLTPREIEVLQWSAHGKEAPMIAGIIGIGVHTVRQYIKSARYKLDAATVSHAVAKAAQMRLITLNASAVRANGER